MNTVYCPIHVPGSYYERSRANKHGLRDALKRQGDVLELDYLNIPPADLPSAIRFALDDLRADLLFTQIQGTTPLTATMLADIRADYPALKIVNWNGDVWQDHLTSPDMLDILRSVNVQLVVNASVLPTYAEHGIHAAFCPFGYERPLTPLPDAPHFDVVFLGNNYSAERAELYDVLRSLSDVTVGIYGSGWAQSEGECNYDFAAAEALYRNAKIAVSDNQFPNARGYLSDRPFQIMAAGGAMLLQQRVEDLERLTGLRTGEHYMPFDNLLDIVGLVRRWMKPEKQDDREALVARAQANVLEYHTWERRVEKLVSEWLTEKMNAS